MPVQRIYEILYIIVPTVGEAEIDEVHEKVKSTITSSGATIRREDKWGKRHLAYEVKNFREGFYAYFEFNATGKTILDLKEMFRLEGRVIRHLITAVPKAKLEEEKRKARVLAEKADLAKKKAEADLAAAEEAAKSAEESQPETVETSPAIEEDQISSVSDSTEKLDSETETEPIDLPQEELEPRAEQSTEGEISSEEDSEEPIEDEKDIPKP